MRPWQSLLLLFVTVYLVKQLLSLKIFLIYSGYYRYLGVYVAEQNGKSDYTDKYKLIITYYDYIKIVSTESAYKNRQDKLFIYRSQIIV